jgi:hypothetical protein
MDEWIDRLRSSELTANGWKPCKQPIPRHGAITGADIGRDRIREGRARAGDPIVESKNPDPATWKYVMKGRVIRRKRGQGVAWHQSIPSIDMCEVGVQPLRGW